MLFDPMTYDVEKFDAKKAEADLRQALYSVESELKTSKEKINICAQADAIYNLQVGRLVKYEKLKNLKEELQTRFPDYRMEGRVKSLVSMLGKLLEGRMILDAFGIKIIVDTIDECYDMASWLERHFKAYAFEDKIENPKKNGYRDLNVIIEFDDDPDMGNTYLEVIIQTNKMFVDSMTIQAHSKAYPWKYKPEILGLPVEYRELFV